MNNCFIILAAGQSKRFKSNKPKQYILYKNKYLYEHTIDKVLKSRLFKHILLVVNNRKLIKKKYPNIIKEVRGRGFLIGLQLYKDQSNFIKKLMDYKMLTIKAAENVVRILPPLNVKKSELDLALKLINKVCSSYK